MEPRVYRLADGRQLGVAALEVLSFPSTTVFGATAEDRSKRLYQSFAQLTTELHKLCGKGACMEILWVTETTSSQAFASSVCIFYIFRKIGTQEQQVRSELTLLMRSLTTTISALQYHAEEVDPQNSRLTELLAQVDTSCTLGITKRENLKVSANSVIPYYTTDIFPLKNSMNFNGIIATMSQMENCCISFQLFPTALQPAEYASIHEMMSTLSQINTGVMMGRQMYRDAQAGGPLKYYGFYDASMGAPVFQYSVLVFGSRDNCNALAAKIASQIQSGSEKVSTCDLRYLDLSSLGIRLPGQLFSYVWAAHNKLSATSGREKIYQAFPTLYALRRLPYLVTVEEAAAFFRLPAHEKSMPALRSNQHIADVEQFAEGVVDPNNIQFGSLMQSDAGNITIGSPAGSFSKHALVVGMPGSGKTTFSVHLLLQFARKGIPFLAIEPTKTEYRGMIDAIDGLRIFTPGKNGVSPFVINPFVPPKGIRLEQYIYGLGSAFQAAFSMPSPLDIIFQKAIQESYNRYGWKDYSTIDDPDVRVFGMHEFILVFKDLMKQMNYSKEIMGNIESAGVLRLTTLIEQNGNIYDTIQSVPIEDLLSAPTVLELNAIDNREQKALIMALLLIQIGLYTKNNQLGDGKLKKIMLIDEAHVLLGGDSGGADGKPDARASSVQAIQDLIVEIRSYGTGIIIADQAPSQVSRPVVANTDIKIAFRLVENTEKKIIADTTNMSEEAMDQLSKLKPGEAFAYYQKLDAPQLIKTEEIRAEERIRLSVPDEEIARRDTYWKTHQKLLRPYAECDLCPFCKESCDFTVRSDAEHLARTAYRKYSGAVKNNEHFKKCILNLPFLMKEEFAAYPGQTQRRLIVCSRIRLYRKLMREKPVQLQGKDKREAISALPKEILRTETEG